MKLREIINEISKSRDRMASRLPVLSLSQPGVEHIETAGIAKDLAKKADKNVHKGTRIFVTGNDGPNLDAEKYQKWLETLRVWLDRGAEINYFLLNPSPKAIKHLVHFITGKQDWKLRVYSVKKSSHVPAATKRLLQDWKTTHFAVFENPPQFWLESRHAPEKTHAEDCYFFPREVAEKSSLPREYREQFDFVIHQCGKPLVVSWQQKKATLKVT